MSIIKSSSIASITILCILCLVKNAYAEIKPSELKLGTFYSHFEVTKTRNNKIPSYINIEYLPAFEKLDDRSQLLSPRFHVGCMIAANKGANQLYSGVTWRFSIKRLFLEISFGGEIHDGPLSKKPNEKKLALGTRLLFRESIGLGINLTKQLTATLLIDHASNAGIHRPNNGLTGGGLQIGYKLDI